MPPMMVATCSITMRPSVPPIAAVTPSPGGFSTTTPA
jgi:hypothetical protein